MAALAFGIFSTPFGTGGVVASDQGVLEVMLPFVSRTGPELITQITRCYPGAGNGNDCTSLAVEELENYFSGEMTSFSSPLDIAGCTPFQQAVYGRVAGIGYGHVCSYGQIADLMGRAGAARGVGSAMAANRLPVIIPCHRVVAADGRLGGFSAPGGIATKMLLLRLEGVNLSSKGRVIFSE
jgi:methylated-DNA-[protein]-cysteine S-methyltransferase